jgi:hypothetical protein
MIAAANANNSDGFGIMWPENGRVMIQKTMGSLKEIQEIIKSREGKPYAMHFRFRTRGETAVEQCHPYTVMSKDGGDGMDLVMMHNGTFSDVGYDAVKSDSALFAEKLRNHIFENGNIGFFDHLKHFKEIIGHGNKLVFMSSELDVVTVNQTQGTWMGGVWFSNTYSLIPPRRWYASSTPSTTTAGSSSPMEDEDEKGNSETSSSVVPGYKPHIIGQRRSISFKSDFSAGSSSKKNGRAAKRGNGRHNGGGSNNRPVQGDIRLKRKVLSRMSPNGKLVQVITYVPDDSRPKGR